MSCINHPDRAAVNTCTHCGKWLCTDCSIETNGVIICKNCAAEMIKNKENPYQYAGHGPGPGPGRHEHRHYRPAPPPHGHGYGSGGGKFYNGFLTFCCALVPGVGYMYLGLIKRGIMVLSSMFLAIYLASCFNSVLAGLSIAVIYCASFFDTFRILRLLRSGVYVEDSFTDITSSLKKYGWLLGSLLVLDCVRGLLRDFFYFGHRSSSLVNLVFGVVIILAGVGIFSSIKNKSVRPMAPPADRYNNTDEFIDKR